MTAPVRYLLLFISLKLTSSFNLDTKFPIIYTDPYKYNNIFPSGNKESSYFGYSLILYPGDGINRRPWIGIGAPKGGSHSDFNHSGVVFQCGIPAKCDLIDLTTKKSGYDLNDAFIGANMDINLEYKVVVTCGYREIFRQDDKSKNMIGSCYWSTINNTFIDYNPLEPLKQPDNAFAFLPKDKRDKSQKKPQKIYNFGQGQAGFSIHLTSHAREILIGAPGIFNWYGSTLIYKDTGWQEDDTIEKESFKDLNIANSSRGYSHTSYYDLLGYSVTSGRFFNPRETLYASSAPKASNYFGKVLIYDFNKNSNSALLVKESKTGTQFGEYFGAALAAGDLNNDGYDDLVVAAPYHANNEYNEGRIYVFFGSPKKFKNQPQIIEGEFTNGQFGTTVQYLGDLDRDGYGDLAVAAPYEDLGVVYIFKGSAGGLLSEASQRIAGRTISENLRGFGMGISKATDIDGNAVPDVAIGAYRSGHAVILRGKPTVAIRHRLSSSADRLEHNRSSFQITACYTPIYNQQSYPSINTSISRTITVDEQFKRASLVGSITKTIFLDERNPSFCENVTINILKNFSNMKDPLTVILSHEPMTETRGQAIVVSDFVSGSDEFCSTCPTYDRYRSDKPTLKPIPFILACGKDNICNSVLKVTTKLRGMRKDDNFILGSSSNVILETNVSNSGENAYSTQMLVSLPEFITFGRIPSNCEELNSSAVQCNVANPLEQNSTKLVSLSLDMVKINAFLGNVDPLDIIVSVYTSNENNDQSSAVLRMNFKREADITISGKSDQQSYYFGNTSNEKVNFAQTFQVQKFGSSPVGEVLIEIEIPFAVKFGSGYKRFISYFVTGRLSGETISCSSTNMSDEMMSVQNAKDLDVYDPSSDDDVTLEVDVTAQDMLIDSSANNSKRLLKRSTRQAEILDDSALRTQKDNNISDGFETLANRTFYINCNMPQISCAKIQCRAGPFNSIKDIAVVDVSMMIIDLPAIKDVSKSKKKDVISFATHAAVSIENVQNFEQSGNRPDETEVASVFLGEIIKPKIDLWIIIVAVVVGLLLLLLLILGLVKAGFFKRSQKEKLDLLKKETEDEDVLVDENGFEDQAEENDIFENENDFIRESQKEND